MTKKDKRNLRQLSKANFGFAPGFWTIEQLIDFTFREFGLDAEVMLPDGSLAPSDMTVSELRQTYGC
jgi:hypothetical protein